VPAALKGRSLLEDGPQVVVTGGAAVTGTRVAADVLERLQAVRGDGSNNG
jgi:hypothetical protein